MALKRMHFLVTGRVQGVFFRAYTKDAADELGLTGWVRNLVDGRVEGCIEGEEGHIEKMLQWLRKGSPHSYVEKLEHHILPEDGKSISFEIIATAISPQAD